MYLIEYVRDDENNLIGCLASTEKGKVGWSLCHDKDRFVKALGRKIAIGRSEGHPLEHEELRMLVDGYKELYKTPERFNKKYYLTKTLDGFIDRMNRYYKD